MSVQFNGYHDFNDLPDLRGKQVKLPAGTEVTSTNPAKRERVLKRAQTVQVHHMGCGESRCVGTVFSNGERHAVRLYREESAAVKAKYGTDDHEVLVHHPDTRTLHGQVFLPISNPTIIWVGSGGYWCEADLNQATWE